MNNTLTLTAPIGGEVVDVYTVEEKNEMRRLLGNKYLFGFYSNEACSMVMSSRSYTESEKSVWVEKELQGLMTKGHKSTDLVDPANQYSKTLDSCVIQE